MSLRLLDHRADLLRALGRSPNDGLPRTYRDNLLTLLPDCEFVLWRHDLFDAAQCGNELWAIEATPEAALPGSMQWWEIDDARGNSIVWRRLGETILRGSDFATPLRALIVWRPPIPLTHIDGIEGYNLNALIVGVHAKPRFTHAEGLSASAITNQAAHGSMRPGNLALSCAVSAGLAFMAQDFIAYERVQLPRRFRGLSRNASYAPIARRVIIRRKHIVLGPTHVKQQREWEHSWSVRGHWRKLHEPRKSDGATVTYVRGHIKGDPEKPFLAPKETIYHVKR